MPSAPNPTTGPSPLGRGATGRGERRHTLTGVTMSLPDDEVVEVPPPPARALGEAISPTVLAGESGRVQTLPAPSADGAERHTDALAERRGGGSGGGPGGPAGRRPPGPRPNYTLRRIVALLILVALLALTWVVVNGLVGLVGGLFSGSGTSTGARTTTPGASATAVAPLAPAAGAAPEIPAPTPSPDAPQGAPGASDATTLVRTMRIAAANLSPKSIVAGPAGLLFAQNMMYHHTISVFRADGALQKTIPDSVDLAQFGITGHPGVSKGSPVEVAFTPDGHYAWVSNYSMYGEGFGPEGLDRCTAGDGTSTSYVYRVDTTTLAVDKVVPVGAVPKYVAVTPDGTKVLVSNWCSWTLSVIDTKTNTETTQIALGGKYPRGIVVSPDSTTAYVALMGSGRIVTVDLATKAVNTFAQPGSGPRHLVISPDAKYLYVTNNSSGTVSKIDRATGAVLATVRTASEPRSMTISRDGGAIYVVNYGSASMSKIRTSDMTVLQTVATDASPIGITYEPTKKQVWVACYGGSLIVFDDSKLKG